MIISDLNHLEVVETEIQGAGYYTYYQNDKVKLDIYTDIDLDDNSAEAFADSLAIGNKSFSKTFTFTKATGYSSYSSSGSFAAVD